MQQLVSFYLIGPLFPKLCPRRCRPVNVPLLPCPHRPIVQRLFSVASTGTRQPIFHCHRQNHLWNSPRYHLDHLEPFLQPRLNS